MFKNKTYLKMNTGNQFPMEEDSKDKNILKNNETKLYILTLLDSKQNQHIMLFDILEKIMVMGYEFNSSVYILESQFDIDTIKKHIQQNNRNGLFSYFLFDVTDNINSTKFKASVNKNIPQAESLTQAINSFRKEPPINESGVRIIGQTEFEALLDKITKQGILSITPEEKASMDLFSSKNK